MYQHLFQDSVYEAGWEAKLAEADYELVSAVQQAHWQRAVSRVGH